MSSTNRGRQRHPDDWYKTPAWAVRAILPYIIGPGLSDCALDPACGDGAILDVVREMRPTCATIGIEIDSDRAAACLAKGHDIQLRDALGAGEWKADAIVMNPPYSLAMEFIQRAITSDISGDIAVLLRLNFLGSQKRAAWHRMHPSDVYVLPKRPAFTPDGKTDSCEYMWAVWGPGRGGRWHVLEVEG